jgi:hypothetical protein
MEEESEKYTNYLWVEDWFLRCQHKLGHQTPGFGDDKWNRIIHNMLYESAITLHDGSCEITKIQWKMWLDSLIRIVQTCSCRMNFVSYVDKFKYSYIVSNVYIASWCVVWNIFKCSSSGWCIGGMGVPFFFFSLPFKNLSFSSCYVISKTSFNFIIAWVLIEFILLYKIKSYSSV